MEREAGGVLMFGIPEYRLPKEVVRKEIAKIEQLGVTIRCNTTVGRDLTIDDLFARGFDAIFMGTGTGKPKRLELPGGGLWGVRYALYFLRRVSLWREGYIGRLPMFIWEPCFPSTQWPSHWRSCAHTRPHTAGRLLRRFIMDMALPMLPIDSSCIHAGISLLMGQPLRHCGTLQLRQRFASRMASAIV